MKVTKLRHSCVLVEENGVRILFDPGSYSTAYADLKNAHVIIITQIHGDHFDIGLLKALLANNPEAKVITNREVGAALEKEHVVYTKIEQGERTTERGILIEAFGNEHAVIYPTLPPAQNTGYFIANRFFHPGDAYVVPTKPVDILALPTGGPWLKMADAVDYAREVKPKICFPIHDGMYEEASTPNHWIAKLLPPLGISFVVLDENEPVEF